MNNTKIKSVHARQIMDAKFRPVTEADVILECGVMGRGAAPTGTSVGSREAFVLRDNDMGKFCGLSVFKAVENINNIIGPALIGMDVTEQEAIDRLMIDLDGTPQKSRLGGNAVYSVSIACMQAAARAANMSFYQYLAGKPLKTLPLPTSNSITGGKYPGRTVCFQEFTFCPYKASCITEAMEIITLVHEEIGRVITRRQHGRSAQRGMPGAGLRILRIRKKSWIQSVKRLKYAAIPTKSPMCWILPQIRCTILEQIHIT